jgi:hypothetical protein
MEALLEATLRLAAPLLLAALGELVIERAGLIDIGIEGTMLTGAFAGFVVAVASGSPLMGVAAAPVAGIGIGALFAAFRGVRTRRPDRGGGGELCSRWAPPGRARAPSTAARRPRRRSAAGVGSARGAARLGAPVRADALRAGGMGAALAIRVGAGTRAGLRLRAVGESARAAGAEACRCRAMRAAVLIRSSLAGGGRRAHAAQSDSSPRDDRGRVLHRARSADLQAGTRSASCSRRSSSAAPRAQFRLRAGRQDSVSCLPDVPTSSRSRCWRRHRQGACIADLGRAYAREES